MSIEILAPVGDEEMLAAAVFSGASAVYLGLCSMNARRAAHGFDAEALKNAVSFCHARNVKVYVTLNTVLYKSELDKAADAIKAIAQAGADAVIVQDLAVARMVKVIAPLLALHGSTQMSVHTLAGALMLKAMGFCRVILARELSLAEIKNITSKADIQTEVFIHGALCVCVSGQCYMSAFLGGRSGNRGSCAGPCRLPFSVLQEGECHLSLKDMSHIKHIKALEEAGVASAKIEGRLRTPEYAAACVNACESELLGKVYDEQLLRNVFSRSGFTNAYIKNVLNKDMFGVRTENDAVAERQAKPKLRELFRRERQSVGIDMRLTLKDDALTLSVSSDESNCIEICRKAEVQPALADCSAMLNKAITKCGGTPFFAKNVTVEGFEKAYISAAFINEMRREALIKLLEKISYVQPIPYLSDYKQNLKLQSRGAKMLVARFENVSQMFDGLSCFEHIILPLSQWRAVPSEIKARTWLELPRLSFAQLENEVIKQITQSENEGFAGYVAQNIAHFELLRGKNIFGSFSLNITNPVAAEEYKTLGAKIYTISPEVMCNDMPFFSPQSAVLAYGNMPLMVTRACPMHNVKSCADCDKNVKLKDRKGMELTVSCKDGYRTIYNPIPIYMGDKLGELSADFAILYFTNESSEQADEIANLFLQKKPFERDFTRGLYFKGTV